MQTELDPEGDSESKNLHESVGTAQNLHSEGATFSEWIMRDANISEAQHEQEPEQMGLIRSMDCRDAQQEYHNFAAESQRTMQLIECTETLKRKELLLSLMDDAPGAETQSVHSENNDELKAQELKDQVCYPQQQS